MELLNAILNRRSIRKYNEKEISDEALNDILEVGLLAPSSRNLHPVELITVKNKDVLHRLAKAKTAGSEMLKNAYCAVVVIGDNEKSDVWIEDCSISMAYMQLRATELGVANCWVQCRNRTASCAEDEENISSNAFVKQVLDIPNNYSVLAILSLGMTDMTVEPHTIQESDFTKVHKEKF